MIEASNWGDYGNYSIGDVIDTAFFDYAGYYEAGADATAQQSGWENYDGPSYWLAGVDGMAADLTSAILGWLDTADLPIGAHATPDYFGAALPVDGVW